MGKLGLRIARALGVKLQAYSDQRSAEASLFEARDSKLMRIQEIAARAPEFNADFTPQSLKGMEAAYFRLWESGSFAQHGTSIVEFEECMAIYLGEVLVRNIECARWVVEEYAFEVGKYELGIRLGAKGMSMVAMRRLADHHARRDNKRRQAIYRDFQRYSKWCV